MNYIAVLNLNPLFLEYSIIESDLLPVVVLCKAYVLCFIILYIY